MFLPEHVDKSISRAHLHFHMQNPCPSKQAKTPCDHKVGWAVRDNLIMMALMVKEFNDSSY